MVIRRKYNTATASGTHIRIPIPKAGSTDFATNSDWTPATGDVKLSKDGGSQANIGTLPSFSNGAWEFQLTNTELSCKQLEIMIVDSATKVIVDQAVLIETFGNASAMQVIDYSAAQLPTNVTQFGGTNGTFASGIPEVKSASFANAAIDSIFTRPTSAWEASAPVKSFGTAVMKLVHKVASVAGTMTIFRSDGTTPHATQVETTDAAADPLTGLDGAA